MKKSLPASDDDAPALKEPLEKADAITIPLRKASSEFISLNESREMRAPLLGMARLSFDKTRHPLRHGTAQQQPLYNRSACSCSSHVTRSSRIHKHSRDHEKLRLPPLSQCATGLLPTSARRRPASTRTAISHVHTMDPTDAQAPLHKLLRAARAPFQFAPQPTHPRQRAPAPFDFRCVLEKASIGSICLHSAQTRSPRRGVFALIGVSSAGLLLPCFST